MNIDPQIRKSDRVLSQKCVVRPCQNDSDQSPEKVDLQEILIIRFDTYLSFSAWFLLHLTISKKLNLTKFDLAMAWSEHHRELLYRF